jgi:pyrroline-5-carboxylate reductase
MASHIEDPMTDANTPSAILMIGCGNMGYALLESWMRACPETDFAIIEPQEAMRNRAASLGAQTYASAGELPADMSPDLSFLAIKPQMMEKVLPDYLGLIGRTTFVSIAAGTSMATLERLLSAEAAIIRTMPNTPAAVGFGMMVSFANPHVTPEAKDWADRLYTSCGETAWIDDDSLMDAVTAISGSGPAYVFHFIECMTQAAIDLGLDPELARVSALQTVLGAGKLASESEDSAGTLRRKVTSPGGTTAAALDVLQTTGALQRLVTDATTAARDRGRQLNG